MNCPNAIIYEERESKLQKTIDAMAGRQTIYKPKDFVQCKAFDKKYISQSYVDKYCKSEKYKDCKGCNGFVIPDFESDSI